MQFFHSQTAVIINNLETVLIHPIYCVHALTSYSTLNKTLYRPFFAAIQLVKRQNDNSPKNQGARNPESLLYLIPKGRCRSLTNNTDFRRFIKNRDSYHKGKSPIWKSENIDTRKVRLSHLARSRKYRYQHRLD